jgi:hypothetical protein
MASGGPGSASIPDDERVKLWVRSGGRCALCKTYLLEGNLTARPLFIGEMAHNVGEKDTARSPRGQAALPLADRNLAENLILLCPTCHTEIDKHDVLDLVTIGWLADRKRDHEERVRKATGLDPIRDTAIVRMVGDLRGRSVELSVATAANAVVTSDARFPRFPLSADGSGLEIDLRHMPGELQPTAAYWEGCKASINDAIHLRLVEAVRRGIVKHVSVFAFARLPLLTYLGSQLDDTYEVEVYQRQRSDESWGWPGTGTAMFTVSRSEPAGREAVLLLNVSGTIDPADLPDDLRDLPRFAVGIDGSPGVDAIASRASLGAFEAAIRGLLASFEEGGKTVRVLHVVAALPISAAVVLGRVHDRHVHPTLAMYDRTDGAYSLALEIS